MTWKIPIRIQQGDQLRNYVSKHLVQQIKRILEFGVGVVVGGSGLCGNFSQL